MIGMATIEEAFAAGLQHLQAGNLQDADAIFRQIVQVNPLNAEATEFLGILCSRLGRPEEAVTYMERALTLRPGVPAFHANLGLAYVSVHRLTEAVAQEQEALRLDPFNAQFHNNLGNIYHERGDLDEALASYQEASRLQPDMAAPYTNRAVILAEMGLLDDALVAFRRAVELQPAAAIFHSNLFYNLHFHPDSDAQSLGEEGRRWNERHAAPLAPQMPPDTGNPDPERRLRSGFYSPDLRLHPIGQFLLPILESHDRRGMETYCYAAIAVPDEFTLRLRGQADFWRDVAGLTDAQLADLVRQDRIDIFVDLTAHLAQNRLLVFARKPAPVQATYLAYCSTTGLTAIDYRLTDPYLDPPDQATPFYSEESVWLPETYWCYRPAIEVEPPGPLPALAAGHVTFGCLNTFRKNMPPALATWRDLLAAVPDSRLLLHAHPGSHRDRVRAFFAEKGIDPGRVEFAGNELRPGYFRLYDRIDIGLDPFPYCGGTTTCDALWMGVPVVTLVGRTAVGRGGLSILSNAGLPELVARTPEEYLRLAAGLAEDLPRLTEQRAGLRARMQASPLMDAPRFTRHFEAALRTMWRRWCASRQPTATGLATEEPG